jgi:hypothetical protein
MSIITLTKHPQNLDIPAAPRNRGDGAAPDGAFVSYECGQLIRVNGEDWLVTSGLIAGRLVQICGSASARSDRA